ncbi:MAG TPA: ParB/RepB/Spo0J family partition protein [Bryobacterales bacterium]|nr:ParB/RepB/Spo0J family partition protein [Bryobacterales bacterium]
MTKTPEPLAPPSAPGSPAAPESAGAAPAASADARTAGHSSGPRRALGRGLSALLPERPEPRPAAAETPVPPGAEQVRKILLDRIDPNPYQPRRAFDPERLEELAASIRADGLVQPVIVRPSGARYILIVGERRWRAARLAGLDEIPALVREISPDRLLEVTLIENIQREDLNPIEVAQAFARMARELHMVHEEIARRTGKDRATVTNLLRLLTLPEDIQQRIAAKQLSVGHAKAILAVETEDLQRKLAESAVQRGLSVRQVERLAQHYTQGSAAPDTDRPPADPNVKAAIAELERVLGTRVQVVMKGVRKGRVIIHYYSQADLDRIYSIIVGESGDEN